MLVVVREGEVRVSLCGPTSGAPGEPASGSAVPELELTGVPLGGLEGRPLGGGFVDALPDVAPLEELEESSTSVLARAAIMPQSELSRYRERNGART